MNAIRQLIRNLRHMKEKAMAETEDPRRMFYTQDPEHPQGPFDTEDLAIADARSQGIDQITLTKVVDVKPEDYLDAGETLIERMNEAAVDAFQYSDDVFFLKDPKAAEEALTAWAREHVGMNCEVHTGDDIKTVRVDVVEVSREKLEELLKMAKKVTTSHQEPKGGVPEGEPVADDLVVRLQQFLDG